MTLRRGRSECLIISVRIAKEAIDFYLQPTPVGGWENSITIRSTRAARIYELGARLPRISPTPILMVVARLGTSRVRTGTRTKKTGDGHLTASESMHTKSISCTSPNRWCIAASLPSTGNGRSSAISGRIAYPDFFLELTLFFSFVSTAEAKTSGSSRSVKVHTPPPVARGDRIASSGYPLAGS